MRLLMFGVALALLSSSGIARAERPPTDLSLSGSQSVEITASDANACYFDDQQVFNGQLTDPSSGLIISINVLGTVGDHPAKAADGHAQLTMLGIDTTQSDPFINWAASGGTVTLDNIDTQVALDDGSASTHGALGHIDADLTSPQGTVHVSGPFACHLAG
ncbi:MAG TPA: hypothetical protein VGJ60_36020 [Chloroflexota bacterium]|jgi:hypothetical protein